MRVAALADLYCGGSGMAFLADPDPTRAEVRAVVASRAAEQARQDRRELAVMLARVMSGQKP